MLGVVQFRPDRRAQSRSLERLSILVRSALDAGTRLLVLPEMAATGYRFAGARDALPFSEPLDGPSHHVLAPLAAQFGAWIVFGFMEEADGRLFNAAQAIGPRGDRVAHYRKRLLFDDDWAWAEPGDLPYPVFETAWGLATVGICMDMNDPRFTRTVIRSQPAVVCFPTSWIDEGVETIHDYWARRLEGFRGYLLASDRWGEEQGVRFWGRSAILHSGRVMTSAPISGDGWWALDPETGEVRGSVTPRPR